MNRIGFSTLALAIGLAAAPAAPAQTTSRVLVCNDGQMTSTRYGVHACDNHRGINQQATIRARQNVYNNVYNNGSNRGVYSGTANGTIYTNGTNGQRGVYNGGVVNGQNRGIYNGGTVYPNGTVVYPNGTVYPNGRANRDNDNDQGNNGKHKGWYKNGKHKGHGDKDRDGN